MNRRRFFQICGGGILAAVAAKVIPKRREGPVKMRSPMFASKPCTDEMKADVIVGTKCTSIKCDMVAYDVDDQWQRYRLTRRPDGTFTVAERLEA